LFVPDGVAAGVVADGAGADKGGGRGSLEWSLFLEARTPWYLVKLK
jgi:hypothetical protein